MRSPLLVVGEHHSPGGSGPAFSGGGSSSRRLESLLGAPVLMVASATNLLDGPPWDRALAREKAWAICSSWSGWIVVCGRRAADAFDVPDFLRWHGMVGAIPHPSGRCRYWNDPEYVEAAREFLRSALMRPTGA